MSRLVDVAAVLDQMAQALAGTEQGVACEFAVRLMRERQAVSVGDCHEIAKNLRLINKWRLGNDERLDQPKPADISRWLDAAADALETIAQLRQRAEQAEAEIERWRVATAKLRDGAEEAGRVANEQIARADAANAELAGALRGMVDAQDATVEQFTETEIDRLEKAMRVSREVLARHAAGEPAKPVIDAEALIRECIPGGSIADPQAIADAIREYAARKEVTA